MKRQCRRPQPSTATIYYCPHAHTSRDYSPHGTSLINAIGQYLDFPLDRLGPNPHRRGKLWVQKGWPDLAPYTRRKSEEVCCGGVGLLSHHKGGSKCAVRMKALTRSYLWWPRLDKDIECHVKECTDYQASWKDPPPTPLHSWAFPHKPWSRVHIDYVGPVENKMFLLVIDAHSRWLEVQYTSRIQPHPQ